MLKILYAVYHCLFPAILSQITLKMCVTTRNHEKFTKTAYFGCLRWFKVVIVDDFMKLVTSACYDKQHVCVYL